MPGQSALSRLLREPLLHFFLLGAALFALYGWLNVGGPGAANEIVVSRGQVTSLRAQFERVWQRSPTAEEMRGLIDSWVREEIYYREGLAMGLDRDDPVVRRRIGQKVQFIIDGAIPPPPTDAQLQAWLDSHAAKYRSEGRYTVRAGVFRARPSWRAPAARPGRGARRARARPQGGGRFDHAARDLRRRPIRRGARVRRGFRAGTAGAAGRFLGGPGGIGFRRCTWCWCARGSPAEPRRWPRRARRWSVTGSTIARSSPTKHSMSGCALTTRCASTATSTRRRQRRLPDEAFGLVAHRRRGIPVCGRRQCSGRHFPAGLSRTARDGCRHL